jgi:hypothetical protein
MATTLLKTDGETAGIWASSRTGPSSTIQANGTSASLMIYPNERSLGKESPFVIGVSHSVDQNKTWSYIQIPTMKGKGEVKMFTFQDLIRALELAPKVDALVARIEELESILAK